MSTEERKGSFIQNSLLVRTADDDSILVYLQVIKWIEEHGETFLLKHTGVGKSLVKAEALLKRHEEFESIAQVSEIEIHLLTGYL